MIICGFGRLGQIIGRVLRMHGIPFTALERDAGQVEVVRRFGTKVYFGDPTRPDVLRAAGAEQAKLLVVALDDHRRDVCAWSRWSSAISQPRHPGAGAQSLARASADGPRRRRTSCARRSIPACSLTEQVLRALGIDEPRRRARGRRCSASMTRGT